VALLDHAHDMLRPVLAAVLAWLVPGLGHLYLGRVRKGLYFGIQILVIFALGLWLGEGASVSGTRFPYHIYGQWGTGVIAILSDHLLGSVPVGHTIDRLELGVVFTTVAGIMNVVVMVDAYETARLEMEPAT
jgi:hypothetical protein